METGAINPAPVHGTPQQAREPRGEQIDHASPDATPQRAAFYGLPQNPAHAGNCDTLWDREGTAS